jgi:hypothetical protein
MSESIQAGYLPTWNPYINYGIPQYGDMSGGYWSPVTWLIASTVGYNAYTLTIELLLYILLGGLGMYKLCGHWINDKRILTMAGLAYMCCGYNVGHLQHFNWISGAAFLPWCLYSYKIFLDHFTIKNLAKTGIFFYMLIASAHPGIIIGSLYFFFAYLAFYFLQHRRKKAVNPAIKKIVVSNILLFGVLTCLSAGMIIGYLDIIPHFVRGEKISLSASLSNPTNLQSWISLVLPFATVKNDAFYNTDITMRNNYFGLALFVFFVWACFQKLSGMQKFLLVSGVLFFLLSTGSIFKIFAYKFLPFIGYVRLNGEFRVFSLLCFIVFSAIALNSFFSQKKRFKGSIQKIIYILSAAMLLSFCTGLLLALTSRTSFIFNLAGITTQPSLSLQLKTLVDSISFYDTFWVQGLIQFAFLLAVRNCLTTGNTRTLQNILVADLLIASLFNIPFTGVGKASVREIQAVLNHSPKGIPIPKLTVTAMPISLENEKLVGNWSWYSKQIGPTTESSYPIALNNMRQYFEAINVTDRNMDLDRPWIFLRDPAAGRVTVRYFSPAKVIAEVSITRATDLILKQNYYPHWFYYLDGDKRNKQRVEKYNINFMRIPVPAGTKNVTIIFGPSKVKWGMTISLVTFICGVVILAVATSKPSSL